MTLLSLGYRAGQGTVSTRGLNFFKVDFVPPLWSVLVFISRLSKSGRNPSTGEFSRYAWKVIDLATFGLSWPTCLMLAFWNILAHFRRPG